MVGNRLDAAARLAGFDEAPAPAVVAEGSEAVTEAMASVLVTTSGDFAGDPGEAGSELLPGRAFVASTATVVSVIWTRDRCGIDRAVTS